MAVAVSIKIFLSCSSVTHVSPRHKRFAVIVPSASILQFPDAERIAFTPQLRGERFGLARQWPGESFRPDQKGYKKDGRQKCNL
ncbi:MAG: hypothetical protein HYZ69_00600 [Candidatus Colwellbacteria bacterium]|nr:hypothetical protein [Candidatus Colwellbacteria bacterium]